MAPMVSQARAARHPVLPDMGRPQMAKADVRIPDMDWSAEIGRAVQGAVLTIWDSNKVAAAALGVDDAEFGKWMSGARRPQFDKLWAHKALRLPLVLALARLANAEVVTEIRFREMA